MSLAKIETLIGTIGGGNKVFTTPDDFVPGSFRIIWNGQVYDAADSRHGYTETGADEVTTDKAPRPSDVLLGFYTVNAGSGSGAVEHADGVQDIPGLKAVLAADRVDRQVRLVEDENAIYRFDVGASSGGIVPDDVDDGRWFKVGDQLLTVIGSPFHPLGILP